MKCIAIPLLKKVKFLLYKVESKRKTIKLFYMGKVLNSFRNFKTLYSGVL